MGDIDQDVFDIVINNSAAKWKEIARRLLKGKSVTEIKNEIDDIEEKSPGKIKVQCQKMFKFWVENDKNATVTKLVDALRKLGLNLTASKIEEMQGTDNPPRHQAEVQHKIPSQEMHPLERNRVALVEKMIITAGLLNYLRQDGVITEQDVAQIKAGGANEFTQNERLLDLLKKRPPADLKKFREALTETNQEHLIKLTK